MAWAMLGDREAAEEVFASLSWTGTGNGRLTAIRVAPYYALVFMDRGEHQAAEGLLRTQMEYCRERGAVTLELNLLPPIIESYVALDRLDEAHDALERAQGILALPEDWRGLAAGVYLAEALLAAAEGRWPVAETAFQRAVETNERYGLVYDQARSLYQSAVIYLDRATDGPSRGSGRADAVQDRDRGIGLLDQALALFQRCDAKKDIERTIALKRH